MKKLQSITAVVAMAMLVVALLLTSFQIAIYGDAGYGFYEKEYVKYAVADSLNMKMDDIMDVTDKMMAYLIGEREELSVVTNVDGKEQDFFNDQDRFHMEEVKGLFLGGLRLRNMLMAGTALLIVILAFRNKKELFDILKRAYFVALAIFGSLTVVLGGLIASDFNRYFTIFHEIFFDNDLWMFDPDTDYMIRMLPEGFFYDFVMRIGSIFVVSLVAFALLFYLGTKYANRKN